MRTQRNIFADAARAKKVLRILGRIPAGATPADVAATAAWLASISQVDRDRLAASAGVSSPSETTWSMVVEEQRARAPEGQPSGNPGQFAEARR